MEYILPDKIRCNLSEKQKYVFHVLKVAKKLSIYAFALYFTYCNRIIIFFFSYILYLEIYLVILGDGNVFS